MKILSATAAAIVAVTLLSALSSGGQQPENRQAPSASSEPRASRKGKASAKQPGFLPVPQQWRMPDGRVVEFPASTSKEEIDALAKRIAEGAAELPAGARVIRWEPVEGATSLLPEYEQRLATIPTTKGKLDALANAAEILQSQIDLMKNDIKYAHARIAIEEKSSDGLANLIDGNAAMLGDHAGRLTTTQNQLDDLKRELDDFKTAACPVLRRAAREPRRSWDDLAGAMKDQDVQMKLDSACRLH
jgi:hypothetical protein